MRAFLSSPHLGELHRVPYVQFSKYRNISKRFGENPRKKILIQRSRWISVAQFFCTKAGKDGKGMNKYATVRSKVGKHVSKPPGPGACDGSLKSNQQIVFKQAGIGSNPAKSTWHVVLPIETLGCVCVCDFFRLPYLGLDEPNEKPLRCVVFFRLPCNQCIGPPNAYPNGPILSHRTRLELESCKPRAPKNYESS